MSYNREETISKFSEEELLEMVKQELNELDIPYKNEPGGFQIDGNWLEPNIFDDTSKK